MTASCYWMAEACAHGHVADCPFSQYMSPRRVREFFGERYPLAGPTPMPSAESYLQDMADLTEEQRRLNRTATAATAWSPHYGGFIMGGHVT